MVISKEPQNLIFDADDTLWENNIYFEEAFDRFCEYLAHSSMTPPQVRAVMDEIESVNARIHGYGSKNYANNLAACLQRLSEREIAESELERVKEFAYEILKKPMELIDGVKETVTELSHRHRLAIFTKGDKDEQQLKVDRSGLAPYFAHTAIVKEKNRAAYTELTALLDFDIAKTWMIGNSPKSDINPALAAGWNAVFVPHPRTWSLEHEAVPDAHPKLLRIEKIGQLLEYFG